MTFFQSNRKIRFAIQPIIRLGLNQLNHRGLDGELNKDTETFDFVIFLLQKYLGDAHEIRLCCVFDMFQAMLLEMVRSMSWFYRMVKAQCISGCTFESRQESFYLAFFLLQKYLGGAHEIR